MANLDDIKQKVRPILKKYDINKAGVFGSTARGEADTNDIDCVVMGTHGRSGLDRLLLGSVTETVIRRTSIPVHIVRVEDGDSE